MSFINKVEEVYAKAFIDLVEVYSSSLNQILGDLLFVYYYIKNPTIDNIFIKILQNVSLKKKNRKYFLLQFLEKYWYKNLNLFRFYSLLSLLIQNDRIILLDKIVQQSLLLSYKKKYFVIAKITSSVKLSWRQKRSIRLHLKDIFGIKKIKLAVKRDLNLIGGYKIEVGSTLIDKSIRYRLNELNSLLGTLKFY